MDYILGLSTVGLSTLICLLSDIQPQPNPASYVQYGALGLCGFMVWFLCDHIKTKEKLHHEERKENAKYLNRIAKLLGDRPCLCDDRDVLDPQNPPE